MMANSLADNLIAARKLTEVQIRELAREDCECREFERDLKNPAVLNRAHRKHLRDWIAEQARKQ